MDHDQFQEQHHDHQHKQQHHEHTTSYYKLTTFVIESFISFTILFNTAWGCMSPSLPLSQDSLRCVGVYVALATALSGQFTTLTRSAYDANEVSTRRQRGQCPAITRPESGNHEARVRRLRGQAPCLVLKYHSELNHASRHQGQDCQG